MDWTRVIAVYGAVLSTLVFGWTIGRDVVHSRRRVRLWLAREHNVRIGGELVSFSLDLRITNTSPVRSVEIVKVKFKDGGLTWQTPDFDGGVRPATSQDPLPVLLAPAQSVEIPLYFGSDTSQRLLETTAIQVEDSAGRRYSLKRRQLHAIQQRVRDLRVRLKSDGDFTIRIESSD